MLRRARALTHLYRLTAQPCRKNSIEIGNRQFLAGSDGPKFPKYLKAPPEDLPKVLHPNEYKSFDAQIKRFVPEFYKELETLVNQYGGLLLRDFPLDGVEDFSNFVAGIESKSMEYLAGIAYRNQVSSNVFTASNEPPCLNIEPHNEMCYKKEWPKWIIFFCDLPAPPGTGGETVLADVREIHARLDPHLIDKLSQTGVMYHRFLPDRKQSSYLCWQENLQCESKQQAEEYLQKNQFEYEWHENEALAIWQVMPALRPHRRTGELVWFNQSSAAHASYTKKHPDWIDTDLPNKQYPLHALYGDGSEIEEEVVQHIRDTAWTCSYGFQMRKGDVIILDNMYIQHGRLSFTDERRLLTSLIEF